MTYDGFAFPPCDHLFTSPVLTSRHAARGCEGHPAAERASGFHENHGRNDASLKARCIAIRARRAA